MIEMPDIHLLILNCFSFSSFYSLYLCVSIIIIIIGSLFGWTYWWGCHSEPTDLQRKEICWYQQGGFGIRFAQFSIFHLLILFLFPENWDLNVVLKTFIQSGDEDEVKERENKQEYNLLCDWIKQQLGDKVAKVQISKRLSSSPCVLVSGKFGWSANMERLVITSLALQVILLDHEQFIILDIRLIQSSITISSD